MTAAEQGPLDPAIVAALYVEHSDELRRFLIGVLRDSSLAQDVLQSTFVKLAEQGRNTLRESRKAWLFRVAFHQALDLRRRAQRGDAALRRIAAVRTTDDGSAHTEPADAGLLRKETIDAVRNALAELPPEQLEVVRLRIYEERTFIQIADQLNIPLGTALGRMHLAVHKLRARLRSAHDSSNHQT